MKFVNVEEEVRSLSTWVREETSRASIVWRRDERVIWRLCEVLEELFDGFAEWIRFDDRVRVDVGYCLNRMQRKMVKGIMYNDGLVSEFVRVRLEVVRYWSDEWMKRLDGRR
jgi:hypothetical protein